MCDPISATFAATSLLSLGMGQMKAQAEASAMNQQAAMADRQAQLQQAQAKAMRDKAAADAAQAERQANAVIGRQNALAGASGAMGDSQTFTDLLSSSERNLGRDQYNIITRGDQQAAIYDANAENLTYTAQGYRAQASALPGQALVGSIASIAQRGVGMAAMGGFSDFGSWFGSGYSGGDAAASAAYGSARPAYGPIGPNPGVRGGGV